jgi:hypothetical protein
MTSKTCSGLSPFPCTLTHTSTEATKSKEERRQYEMSMHREGNMLTWGTVDLADMSFAEQLHAMRKTNVLVGVHGAGLMLVVFTAEESILLEIHPNYRQPSSPSLTPPLSEQPRVERQDNKERS